MRFKQILIKNFFHLNIKHASLLLISFYNSLKLSLIRDFVAFKDAWLRREDQGTLGARSRKARKAWKAHNLANSIGARIIYVSMGKKC